MALIGIDLGTTNSLIAYWQDGKAQLIPNSLGNLITPSVVGLDDDGQIIVGEVAKQRLVTHPHLTASEFKRYMGSGKRFSLGQRHFRAEELSALVLKSLIADAAAHLNESITHAVISVPAYFSDSQRRATRDAGTLAGITVDRLINEPTAAAIAYGLHEQATESTFLVFDLGGGTFDVSILELFEGVMQVNASAGDNHLGGEDFVNLMMDAFIRFHKINELPSAQLSAWRTPNNMQSQLTPAERAQLRASCEKAKCQLSSQQSAMITLQRAHEKLEFTIERADFERLSKPLLDKLRQPLERALKDAKLIPSQLDHVILVGGASRMPVIRSLVGKMLSMLPLTHINPDEIVCQGAAVQAALIAQDHFLKEIVLTDVAPYTLGVGLYNQYSHREGDQLFHPIIERNSPVPISKVDTFYTLHDSQQQIRLQVFQGESRLVKDNIKLGELNINLPRAARGQEINVRFTYDISGLLEVELEIVDSGEKHRLLIEGNPDSLSAAEIQQRLNELSKLKIHPRQNSENALILARGERLYEILRGEARQFIGHQLTLFESILNRQIPSEIAEAARELKAILDKMEQDSPLR